MVSAGTVGAPAAAAVSSLLQSAQNWMGYMSEAHSCGSTLPSSKVIRLEHAQDQSSILELPETAVLSRSC